MAASVPAELAPRVVALEGARRKLAAATPKRLHPRNERNDFLVEEHSLEVRALLSAAPSSRPTRTRWALRQAWSRARAQKLR